MKCLLQQITNSRFTFAINLELKQILFILRLFNLGFINNSNDIFVICANLYVCMCVDFIKIWQN